MHDATLLLVLEVDHAPILRGDSWEGQNGLTCRREEEREGGRERGRGGEKIEWPYNIRGIIQSYR